MKYQEFEKLHNEEHRYRHSAPNVAKVMKSRITRWVIHVARANATRSARRIVVGKPERSRPLVRPSHRWMPCQWVEAVSELRPQTGLLFIPQVIYEYGQRWWNDIYRGN
jgi:hypothetical protein